jgi:hypothetical protein
MTIAIIMLIYALSAVLALLLIQGAAIGKDQALEDEEQMLYIERYVRKRQDKLKRKECSL